MYHSFEIIFEGNIWEILQGMLILRLYAITIEKTNRLGGKIFVASVPLSFSILKNIIAEKRLVTSITLCQSIAFANRHETD